MKFRNKKTGEKYEAISHEPIDIYFYNPAGRDRPTKRSYDSIAELNKEWEDYKPAEPLIKDEKIRKAIRAWAEANNDDGETRLKYYRDDNHLSTSMNCIEFNCFTPLRKLEDGATYTITELCGEEEEC